MRANMGRGELLLIVMGERKIWVIFRPKHTIAYAEYLCVRKKE